MEQPRVEIVSEAPELNPVEECIKCFTKARQNLILGAKRLYELQTSGEYKQKSETFGEFVEEYCQISEGMASKLIKVWKHYHIEGGLAAKELEGVDSEKLYLGVTLKGTPEEQLKTAKVLTRQEIKEQAREEEHGPCDHEGEPYELFRKYQCGKWEKHEEK